MLARRIKENRSTLRANAEDADGLPCRHLRIGVMIVVIVAYVMFGLRVKMCVWLGVSRGLDLAFLNAD